MTRWDSMRGKRYRILWDLSCFHSGGDWGVTMRKPRLEWDGKKA